MSLAGPPVSYCLKLGFQCHGHTKLWCVRTRGGMAVKTIEESKAACKAAEGRQEVQKQQPQGLASDNTANLYQYCVKA